MRPCQKGIGNFSGSNGPQGERMEVGGTWQEWLVVMGYLSFALFIIWRVIVSSSRDGNP